MFSWNNQDQVEFLLWGKHRKNEDHILPIPTDEGNTLLTFGERSKKQRDEAAINTTRSTVDTSGAKYDFLDCNMENGSGNSFQDCDDSILEMDAWSDFPYLSSVLNDGSDQDSEVTGLMNDLANASNLHSGAGIMTRYRNSSELFPYEGISSLSKLCAGDEMQLDGEPELFGEDDEGNGSFLDYDWADIDDLDDLDKILKNNDSFARNEKVQSANSFQQWTVPGVLTSMEQSSDAGSPYYQLGEYSDANVNSLLAKKGDGQSQTWRSQEEERGKSAYFQGLDYSYSSEKHPISSSRVQVSNVNPSHIILSPPPGQLSFSHGVAFSDYENCTPLPQAYVESNHHKPINGGLKANLNHSKTHKISNKAEAAVPKARENIEKFRRGQKMQAMLAIQKQSEQYGHQTHSTDDSVSQDCLSKNQTPEVSYLEERYQSEVMSSSINGRSVAAAVYHQLQYTMQKLDLRIRLNIRDSLFRLARNAMERLDTSNESCTDENKDESKICINEESNNHDRSSSMPDSEKVTNPMDRIVAHLLFRNSSVSCSLPIGDGTVPMTTSMGTC